jgi:hypothetical protein
MSTLLAVSEDPPADSVEPVEPVAPRPPAAVGSPLDPSAAREARAAERAARRAGKPPASESASTPKRGGGMLPGRERRRFAIERGFVRLIATGGIVGIAVILGAVLVGQDVAGWIVGAVIGTTSVLLAALLWSSRQL